jgi:hypothetical protein
MATPINIEDAWQISPSRNNNIPFNYVYDKQLERWVPETKETSIGSSSFIDSAVAFIRKFGTNEDVSSSVSDAAPETVWDGSSLYVFPPDVGTGVQISSSNTGDTQQVIIQGLDQNFLLKNWTGNLNGTGVVNLDGQWSRVFRGYNDGSTSFAGTINLHASGDPSLSYLKIISTDNQTLMAIYTIPANYTGYLVSYNMTAHNSQSSSNIGYNIKLKTREFGKVFRTQCSTSVSTSDSMLKDLTFPIQLNPKTDIKFDVVSANGNNGAVDVEFNIALLS